MKIAFFTDGFLPKYDGVIIAVLSLAEELAKMGNEILIFAPKPKKGAKIVFPFENKDKRVKTFLLPSAPALIYPEFRLASPAIASVTSELKKFKAEVVHFHSPLSIGLTGITAAKILNKPLVGTFHTYFMEPEGLRLFKLEKSKALKSFLWKFSNFLHDRTNLTICPSRYVMNDLKKQGVKSPLSYIPNGIKIRDLTKVDLLAVKKKSGLPRFNLLYAGRISKEKNLNILIDALPQVKKEIPDFKLNLIGDGPIVSDLLKQALKLKVSANINFFGAMKHEELMNSSIYQTSDLFITPSTFDTQCISAVEAMMFGLPLVVAKSKGLTELISGNGLAVWPINKNKLAQTIIYLLKNEKLRKVMGEKSRKLSLNFDIKKTAKRTFEEYQKITTPKKPGWLKRLFGQDQSSGYF